jgi:two-component system OmpR family response regulator
MTRLDGMKILIAEDEPFMRNVLYATLVNQGATVYSYEDGEAALAAMESRSLDIEAVLLDFMMPKAHGLHVLKEIRAGRTSQPRGLPVGMLTSASDQRTVALSVRLDCDAFIVKPLQKPVLLERMERLRDRLGREARPVEFYEAVDVGAPGSVIADRGIDLGEIELGLDSAQGVRMALADLLMGMTLAEDLRIKGGEVVVPKGITITDELLAVLHDLDKIMPLPAVAIA